jgi:hypothetical protein
MLRALQKHYVHFTNVCCVILFPSSFNVTQSGRACISSALHPQYYMVYLLGQFSHELYGICCITVLTRIIWHMPCGCFAPYYMAYAYDCSAPYYMTNAIWQFCPVLVQHYYKNTRGLYKISCYFPCINILFLLK